MKRNRSKSRNPRLSREHAPLTNEEALCISIIEKALDDIKRCVNGKVDSFSHNGYVSMDGRATMYSELMVFFHSDWCNTLCISDDIYDKLLSKVDEICSKGSLMRSIQKCIANR